MSFDRANEFPKIVKIIAEQMSVSVDIISENTSFTDDLGADSLDIFQVISELEDMYDVEFANEDASDIKTVGNAVNYIAGLLNEK